MGRYILKRTAMMVPLLLGVTVIVFVLLRLIPGDAIDAQLSVETWLTPQARAELAKRYGLDQPIPVQYGRWLIGLVQGDLGYSFRTSEPVLRKVAAALPVTVQLGVLSVFVAMLIGVPLGVISAVKRNTPLDMAVRVFGLLGLSLPSFWFATLLLLLASRVFDWLPPTIYVSPLERPFDSFQQMLMPVTSLSFISMAVVVRMTRSSMLEVLSRDYVRTARAKGLAELVVLFRHSLKNAFIPVLTVVGLQMGTLLGGVVVIEQIFALPGMGWLLLNAIYQRDYPVVQAMVLVISIYFLVIILIVDILYAYLDPRIRYGG